MLYRAEENAHLLYELRDRLGAKGFGSISKFFEVEPEWRCPCCHRSKPEIARLDRNGCLLCSIHEHHDHFDENVHERLPWSEIGDYRFRDSVIHSLVRFPPVWICNDCNVVEPAAKTAAGAPGKFSFTPYEIASFIVVTPNAPHKFEAGRVVQVYETALPAMKILADRLRAMRAAVQGDLNPIGASFQRVLDQVRAKREDAA